MEADYSTHKQLDGGCGNMSIFLELSSTDDLVGFKREVEEEDRGLDESSLWYGRRIGSKKMGFEERTPLMIAALFGSQDVLTFILQTGRVDPNRACGSDGATALHCAAASGSSNSLHIVKLLLASSADINSVDANGNRPADLIPHSSPKSRTTTTTTTLDHLELLLEGNHHHHPTRPEKKEYPVDPTLPDIKNGIYITDEFRMYTFKVRPCSRAYSHDWTECPFVHPGENARRRDPRTHSYSCVPCPEFRKGSCSKGDSCDYSHGIFECWLHPAQYKTRLCKDEGNCTRRVCFFAHKIEDLRPVYASTGSAVPSPRSMASLFDNMAPLSPVSLGSSSSSPVWQNQLNMVTPPALQLQGSRLKTALNARDMGLEAAELLDLEKQIRRQQLLEELAALSSSNSGYSSPFGNAKLPNLDDVLLGLPAQSQSPTRANHHIASISYSSSGFSSPVLRPCGSPSRSAGFAMKSQSLIDHGAVARLSGLSSPAPSSPTMTLSPWGSPSGKLDWGIQGEELNKLRKCTSFGIRSGLNNPPPPEGNPGVGEERKQSCLSHGESEMSPSWGEQFYLEQQQMVA